MVRLPQFLRCACGHTGGRHRDDLTCAVFDCDCMQFMHPVARHVVTSPPSTGRRAPVLISNDIRDTAA